MDPVTVYAEFYSPRWGHTDRYAFTFDWETLTIGKPPRQCVATWHPNIEPTWQGPLLPATLRNDGIDPPGSLESTILHLWAAWRNSELDAEQLQQELTALAEYINACTMAKPKTAFWKTYF